MGASGDYKTAGARQGYPIAEAGQPTGPGDAGRRAEMRDVPAGGPTVGAARLDPSSRQRDRR